MTGKRRIGARAARALRCAALAAAPLLLLTSCFTAALWNLDRDDNGDLHFADELRREVAAGKDGPSFLQLLLLTPLTLALDCLTCPIQAAVYGLTCDDDDEGHDHDQPEPPPARGRSRTYTGPVRAR